MGEVLLTEFVSTDGIVFVPICGTGMINEGETLFASADPSRLLAMTVLDVLNK